MRFVNELVLQYVLARIDRNHLRTSRREFLRQTWILREDRVPATDIEPRTPRRNELADEAFIDIGGEKVSEAEPASRCPTDGLERTVFLKE